MSAKQNIEDLIATRNAFQERVKRDEEAIEQETQRLVKDKLAYLATVGNSVLTKKLGHGWAYGEITFLGDIGQWLKNPYAKVTGITSDKIVLVSESAKSLRPGGVISIDRKYLHMSDRDFAKILRNTVYARKAYLKRLELDTAAKSIQELEADIAKKNQEIVRLQNLSKTRKTELEEKTKAARLEDAK